MAFLTADPIEIESLLREVSAPERGAVTTFIGTVRNHHAGREVQALEYEAFGPMAEAECGRIVAEAESRWPCRIALRHRVGRLGLGETAVGIAAASAHRDESFQACRYVIEELKRRVPIWKRERYADGSEAWVDPTAPQGIIPSAQPETSP
jgi:molybdopterin synthase catalytic subunit